MKKVDPMIVESAPTVLVETPAEAQYGLPIQEILRVVRRRFLIIALTVVLLMGIAVGVSFLQTPVYEASIKIMVGQERGSDAPISLGSDVQGLQQLAQTMAEAISTRPVAEGVIQELDLRESPETFLENLSVEVTSATQFIEVSYEDTSPERAKRIVNAVGDEFSEEISDVSPTTNAITATVWERATTPDTPVSPNPIYNGLIALVGGTVLGIGLAFLLEYLDDSWQSPEEVEQVSGVPTFGVIPSFEEPKAKKGDG